MMNGTLSKIIIFTAGAAVGSAVTWKLIKDKYERMALEDIQSVREFYTNKLNDSQTGEPEVDEESEESDEPKLPTQRDIYTNVVNGLGYSNQEPPCENNEEEDEDDVSEPYVISPSEYGELDYETESLWYHEGDGVVTTYFGEVINKEDIPDMIGSDFAEHYGEYEEDSVHVRNDRLKIDFEILRDLDAYSEKGD